MLSRCRSIDWSLTFFKLICLGRKRGICPGRIVVGRLQSLPLVWPRFACPRIDRLLSTAVDPIVLDTVDEVDSDLYLHRVLCDDYGWAMDFDDDEEGW